MLTPMRVHLIRHGEVENPDHILYGRQPGWSLSQRGLQMAKEIGAWSESLDLAALLVSPLQRAQETAAPISEIHNMEIRTDERLIEASNIFEGERFAVGDGVLRHPRAWKHLYNPWRPSWGEPYVEQINRMLGAIFTARDIAMGNNKEDAICISHQLPIWIVRSAIENRSLAHDPRKRECSLCSVTTIHFDEEGMITSTSYSEPVRHLLIKNK